MQKRSSTPRLRYGPCLVVMPAILIIVGCQGISSAPKQSSGGGSAVGQLAVAPPAMSFGNVPVGSNAIQKGRLTAGASDITVSAAAGKGQGYSLSGISFPVMVPAGQSVPFTVTFAPQSAGNTSGSIAFDSNATNSPSTETLTGSGAQQGGGTTVGQLAVAPSTMSFGNVAVGSNAIQKGTLTAGGSDITVSAAAGKGQGYSLSGISFPVMVPAGQSVPFTVTFAPQSAGNMSGSIAFDSNATNSPTTETVTGSGTEQSQHSVALSWDASTSQVVGYNIYRGVASGGPYTKLNTSSNASTVYTDNSVQSGQVYYYVTTAVDSSNVESSYSNQTTAVIPPP
jgi:hypothetical protein